MKKKVLLPLLLRGAAADVAALGKHTPSFSYNCNNLAALPPGTLA
ncbi:MAG TPA: hypothetical protein VNN62_18400 [Methylomirabilota bacterium]|jgi:hypothetical protein|nr:hypothetical protein [Methylomirabilota bacterium]